MSRAPATIHARQRRTLWVGVSAITMILLVGRGVPALVRWRAANQREAAELRAEWRRASADIQRAPAVRVAADQRALDLGDAFPSLLHGVTVTAASGSLMELIGQAANDADVRLGPVDVHADSAGWTVYIPIAARIEASGDVRGITQFLADLDGSDTRLRVRALQITQTEPFAAASRPELLQLSLVLEGLARRPVGRPVMSTPVAVALGQSR